MSKRAWLAATTVFLTGCAGHQQSALDSVGPESLRTERLFWFFAIVSAIVFVLVIGSMLGAIQRRSKGIEQEPLETLHAPSAATEKRLAKWVGAAVTATVLTVLLLLVLSVFTGRAISRGIDAKNAITVEVVGNQWWWYVRYLDDNASQILVTANEMHIPVGRPVLIRGESQDVIHSFWIPNLNGKRDLIPSRVTTEYIQADRPGRYRGQCAEFCGLQHAHMALWVIAEPPEQFDAWKRAQLKTSVAPADAHLQRGREVFLSHACVFCHTIAGTIAQGQTGPDLTHVGSRISLAAGTVPNTRGNLAGWIVDPQNVKPGNHMASVPLGSDEIQPLVDYLESLK